MLARLGSQGKVSVLMSRVSPRRRLLNAGSTPSGLMLTLCHRREVSRRYRLRVTLPQRPLVQEESPDLEPFEPFPLLLANTHCPICIGDKSKSYKERMGCFSRVSNTAAGLDIPGFLFVCSGLQSFFLSVPNGWWQAEEGLEINIDISNVLKWHYLRKFVEAQSM